MQFDESERRIFTASMNLLRKVLRSSIQHGRFSGREISCRGTAKSAVLEEARSLHSEARD